MNDGYFSQKFCKTYLTLPTAFASPSNDYSQVVAVAALEIVRGSLDARILNLAFFFSFFFGNTQTLLQTKLPLPPQPHDVGGESSLPSPSARHITMLSLLTIARKDQESFRVLSLAN